MWQGFLTGFISAVAIGVPLNLQLTFAKFATTGLMHRSKRHLVEGAPTLPAPSVGPSFRGRLDAHC
jgi:hypothetical protein